MKYPDFSHAFNRKMKIISFHLCKWSDSLVVRWQFTDQAYLDRNLEKPLFLFYCQIASFFKFKIVLVFMSSRNEFYIFHLYLALLYSLFPRFPHCFLVRGDFCCLLITFANSLIPDQYILLVLI